MIRKDHHFESKKNLPIEFFNYLERKCLHYVVVGDTRGYPKQILSDIDIVIDPSSLSNIGMIFSGFCLEHDITFIQQIQHEQAAWYFVFASVDNRGNLQFLDPDICTDYFRWGRRLLRAEELLAEKVRQVDLRGEPENFHLPAPCLAFIYYLLKKIDKGELNDRHGEYLSTEWKKEPTESLKQIKRFWPDEDAALIASSAEQNDWATVQEEIPRLQKTLDANLSFSPQHWWRELVRKVKRIFQPTGLLVSFLGSDGAGKSTVLNHVKQDLAPAFRHTKQYHLRPFFGRSCGIVAPTKNPHDQVFRGFFSSFMKLILWWADFTIGYAIDVFPRLVCSTLILFDRYYYDILIDPKRYRYGGPLWLSWLIGKCIPSPDIVIFLDAPSEILIARKQEISLAELAAQRIAYQALIGKMENGHVVDATRPFTEVKIEVDRIILDFMKTRTTQRLGIKEKTNWS